MKQKMMALFIGCCLLCTACQGGDRQETKTTQNQNEKQQEDKSSEEKALNFAYTDYSKDMPEEETGTVVLKVQENCPVAALEGNEEAKNRINRVFEQQHTRNEARIESDFDTAEHDFELLDEQEQQQWKPYEYSYIYENMYSSSTIVSMKATQKEELGLEQSFEDVVAYTFYVPEGALLTLSEVFADENAARNIVETHIQETVTDKAYEKYLLEDYESYISDILTEEVFYLNEEGMVIICNPGLLTEEEAGVIEIHVPYQELKDVMNEKYLPEDK